MRNVLIAAAVILGSALAWAGDDLAARRDLYGPAATQWNYATVCGNATIKASGGVLHCITISSAPANVWAIRDATASSNGVSISTFPASAQVGTYCYDAKMDNGIMAVIPASVACSITVSYR